MCSIHLGRRIVENVPSGPTDVPVLIEGAADMLVTPTSQDAYVTARRDARYVVDYRTYAGRDHVGLVKPDSPLIPHRFAWTKDRFAGRP